MEHRRITRKHTGYTDVRSWKRNNAQWEKSFEDNPENREGYVYIFRLHDNYCKIGHTINIDRRMKELSASCPTLKCVFLARVKDRFLAEADLHKKMKSKKISREIFILESGDIETADRIVEKFR